MGIEPFLVGSSIDAVLAQRLARRLCDWCKEPYAPTFDELRSVRWPTTIPEPEKLWRAAGCRSCTNTGFRGRLALNEVMPVSEEIERLTVARASATEIARIAASEGMISLAHDGLGKAALGLTTLDEVFRVTV
jgi:type IV pilus assembly protein PilB